MSEEEQTLSRFPAPEDLEYPDEPEEIKKEELDLDMTVEIKSEQLMSSLPTKNEGEKEYEEEGEDEENEENEENDKSSSTKRSFWMRIVLFIILLLVSVLYYYTGILKRPLTDLPFLDIIFPSANAQKFDSLKKKLFSSGLQGFVLDHLDQSKIPDQCQSLDSYTIKIKTLLSRQKNNLDPWKKILEKCSFSISKLHYFMLKAPAQIDKTIVESYLKQVALHLAWKKRRIRASTSCLSNHLETKGRWGGFRTFLSLPSK